MGQSVNNMIESNSAAPFRVSAAARDQLLALLGASGLRTPVVRMIVDFGSFASDPMTHDSIVNSSTPTDLHHAIMRHLDSLPKKANPQLEIAIEDSCHFPNNTTITVDGIVINVPPHEWMGTITLDYIDGTFRLFDERGGDMIEAWFARLSPEARALLRLHNEK